MATTRREVPAKPRQSRRPPARSPEERENQLIAMATDVAEEQMRNGTASAQVITHFLKLGSTSEKLAQQYKAEEIHLLRIKAETIQSQRRTEGLMQDALQAFRAYSGNGPMPREDDDEA